jgi:hypothetical protein
MTDIRRSPFTTLSGLVAALMTVVLTTPAPVRAQSAVAPKAKAKEGATRPDASAAKSADSRKAAESAKSGVTSQSADEKWQVIYMGKSRVGYGRSKISNLERDGQQLRLSETEVVLVISRFGQSVKMKTLLRMEEDLEGAVRRFDFEVHNPPSQPTRTAGVVTGDKVALSNEINGKSKTNELNWDAAIRGPGWIELDIRAKPLQPKEVRKYTTFDPQFSKPDVITIKAGEVKAVPLLGGESRDLLEAKVSHSVFAGVQTSDYYTTEGDSLKSVMSLLQTTSYTVPKEEALKALSGGELDLGLSTLVRLDKPLKNAHQTKRVVYKVTSPGLDPNDLFKAGDPQSMKRLKEDTAEITVRSIREPGTATGTTEVPPEFLASNSYIQCDDAKVVEFANAAAGEETDPWKVAVKMERWVYENLKKKNFSTLLASAAETAQTLSGDCTEHSVLLVGMARAKKIPARAVVGLLYVPALNAFGGHMWSEVHVNGQWVPLDATLGKGFAAAERIKFGETSFAGLGNAPLEDFLSMAATLGNLRIEVLEAE